MIGLRASACTFVASITTSLPVASRLEAMKYSTSKASFVAAGCSPRRIRDHGRSLKKEPQSGENAFGQNSTCPTPKDRQEQRLRVLESSASLASENTHLCGAAHDWVFRSNWQEAGGID